MVEQSTKPEMEDTKNGSPCTTQDEKATETLVPLTDFMLFPKFPPELQIKIWKHAIPLPRPVRVNVDKTDNTIRLKTNTPVPALLSACKTSRQVILSVYKTCLESGEKKIRMDGVNDVLVLSCTTSFEAEICHYDLPWLVDFTMDFKFQMMFSTIRNLAMPNYGIYSGAGGYEDLDWFLSLFQSLERYFPLEGWQTCDPNTGEHEIGFEIPEEDLARLGLKPSAELKELRGLTVKEKKIYEEKMKLLKDVNLEVDVVLALIVTTGGYSPPGPDDRSRFDHERYLRMSALDGFEYIDTWYWDSY